MAGPPLLVGILIGACSLSQGILLQIQPNRRAHAGLGVISLNAFIVNHAGKINDALAAAKLSLISQPPPARLLGGFPQALGPGMIAALGLAVSIVGQELRLLPA